jgi:hypothetical protein
MMYVIQAQHAQTGGGREADKRFSFGQYTVLVVIIYIYLCTLCMYDRASRVCSTVPIHS